MMDWTMDDVNEIIGDVWFKNINNK